jgi:hypothetical protein
VGGIWGRPVKTFDGPAEALASYRYVFGNRVALARTAGAWILIMTIVLYWSLAPLNRSDQGEQIRD